MTRRTIDLPFSPDDVRNGSTAKTGDTELKAAVYRILDRVKAAQAEAGRDRVTVDLEDLATLALHPSLQQGAAIYSEPGGRLPLDERLKRLSVASGELARRGLVGEPVTINRPGEFASDIAALEIAYRDALRPPIPASVGADWLGKACYLMSEPHLSGYRVILGFNNLNDAQDAQTALSRMARRVVSAPLSAILPDGDGARDLGDKSVAGIAEPAEYRERVRLTALRIMKAHKMAGDPEIAILIADSLSSPPTPASVGADGKVDPATMGDVSSLIAARCSALPGALIDCPVCGAVDRERDRLAASVGATPCFECGSTERIGTACKPCNPELASVGADWVLMPREPTQEMQQAGISAQEENPPCGHNDGLICVEIYRAMVARRPSPTKDL